MEDENVLIECLKQAKIDNVDETLEAIKNKQVKEKLIHETDRAVEEEGVFGVPTLFVSNANNEDKQMYWGSDRWHLIANQLNQKI